MLQELRKTLEDGNLVIEIVRTLRGAKCDEATFEPPKLKPAKISGTSAWTFINLLSSVGSLPPDQVLMHSVLQSTAPAPHENLCIVKTQTLPAQHRQHSTPCRSYWLPADLHWHLHPEAHS